MKHSKRSKSQGQEKDYISELPDSIIFKIFWFIPMHDVVRTTILSKRWRNLWTTTPYLNFYFNRRREDNDEDNNQFRCFVNRVLFRWNGPKILKFKVETTEMEEDFTTEYDEILRGDMESWVNFIKEKKVEEFDMALHRAIDCYEEVIPELCWLPWCLYSCSSLRYRYDPVCPCADAELTICTPNLETLKVEGTPFANFRLINVSSLTHATIAFYALVYRFGYDCCFGFEKGFASQNEFGDKFIQILQTIPHVVRVTLHYCCLQVLRAIKMRGGHSTFPTIKCLKIRSFGDNYEELVDLLEIFPQLERLVLVDSKVEYCNIEAEEYEANIPKSFLLQLRTIEVTWICGDSVFSLLEILLKYARKLEKMVFRVAGTKSSESLLLASKKLLQMPRSSNCIIDFLHK